MSGKIIEMITAKEEADELHRQIMAAGQMATIAIVEMARCLKRMRDGALYAERGFDTFDEYVETDVGIGKRHAYNYIHVYEQFGDTALQSNARLGITKLELLARLPIAERQEFLDDPSVEQESVAQLKAKIADLQKKGEQMSLLEEENNRLQAEIDKGFSEAVAELENRNDALKEEKAALAERLDEATKKQQEAEERLAKAKAALKKSKENPKIPDSMLAEIRKEEAERAEKDAEAKIAAELKEAQEAAVTAKAEKERADEAVRRLLDVERKLKAAAPEVASFKACFENVQTLCAKMNGIIRELKESDSATAEKLCAALVAFADNLRRDATCV